MLHVCCRADNGLGESVEVYADCEDFSVNLDAQWLFKHVLCEDSKATEGVVFRQLSHELLLSAVEKQLPPQLALACKDSRISSKTASGFRVCAVSFTVAAQGVN